MVDLGQVWIRIPSRIKRGDVVRVRCLVTHPMERVERTKDGTAIDRDYRFINRVVVTYRGDVIAEVETTQSISENPFFVFGVRATEPGPLTVKLFDTHGGVFEGSAAIRFA